MGRNVVFDGKYSGNLRCARMQFPRFFCGFNANRKKCAKNVPKPIRSMMIQLSRRNFEGRFPIKIGIPAVGELLRRRICKTI